MNWDICIVAIYVMLLVGMGLYGGRKVKTAADFTAAEGHYGTWVLFASLSASYVGGGYSAGNAAESFSGGLGMTVALFGFSLSMICIGKFLVPGVGRFTGETTAGGVIGRAYGRSARVLTGLFSFFCCAGVVAAQMEGMGQVFHVLLGISPAQGILLGSTIVLVYSTFGGLQSVIKADIIQFILLAVGMPVLLILGLQKSGDILGSVPAAYFNPLQGTTPLGFLSLFLVMGVGEALAPPYTQRLLVGKSPRTTGRATVLSGLFSIPFFLVTGLIGLVAYALHVTDTASLAMPALIQTVLPVGIRGVVMAAMVSIMLSAADGFLNSAAIGMVCDGILPLFPRLQDKTQLRLLRLINVGTGIAGILLAFAVPDIMDILMLAYTFWCPLILVPLAAAFLGVESNGRAFRYALLTGLVLTVVWKFLLHNPLEIDGSIVGLLGNLGVFTLCTRHARQYRQQRLAVWK